jgi:hypothetical protein
MKTKMSKVFGAHAGLMSFVLGFTLLASPVFIEVPDPISNGTGIIQGAQGLDVTGIEVDLVDHFILNLECGWDFERYTYDVKISVVNDTAAAIYGNIVVNFHNPAAATAGGSIDVEGLIFTEEAYAGLIEAVFPIFVEVAAGTTQTIEETFVFDGLILGGVDAGTRTWDTHTVTVTTEGEFISPYGGGTGKVSIIEWLKLL